MNLTPLQLLPPSKEKLLAQHKVYVIGGNHAIERIFKEEGAENVRSIAEASIVVWTGGADVSPELYKEIRHPTTTPNPQRDKWEAACFKQAQAQKKICVGICRGGQFLNVMNGGSLWQDVNNHAINGEHPVLYTQPTGEAMSLSRTIMVTSTHHQMMIPNIRDQAGQVWAWAGLATRKAAGVLSSNGSYLTFAPKPGHQTDCEIVYYNRTKSLCFQPHPEYSSKSTKDLFFNCIERVLAA